MMSITLAPSALQETFGVAGRALMFLTSFMLCAGFYLSAVHLAQDSRVRRLIKTSAGSKVFGAMATAHSNKKMKRGFRYHRKAKMRLSKNRPGIPYIIRTRRYEDLFG